MALTQVGSHLMPATIGQHFHHTHKRKEPQNELLCNCSWDYRASVALGCSLKKMTLRVQKSSSSGLKNSSSIRTFDTQVKTTRFRKQPSFARAAMAETDTDNASQKRGAAPEPKERVVEINPFEIPKASPLQTAASVALTSLIGVLLFRSARRRAQRAKGVRLRSDREESVDLLAEAKANSLESIKPNVPSLPPSKQDEKTSQRKDPLSVLGGAALAGAMAYGLWIFTTKVEAIFNAQTVSADYQIRQISVTIRTIVVGLSYLSTFVFGFNSIGLVLYAGQLALGLDEDSEKKTSTNEVPPAKDELEQ